VILLDTSGLLAALDASQSHHTEAAASLAAARPPLLLSPFVLAELDYLIASRVGPAARGGLLEEVERGAYLLEPITGSADIARAHAIIQRYTDLQISLADASIVVLAERHRVRDVLTLDERHFRVLTANSKPFRLLPADA
jgi:predicted nucleic acid-binding protein